MILYRAFYLLAWAALGLYWIVDPSTWLIGLGVGWLFHMIVCSVILHKYITHRTFTVHPWLHPILIYIASLNLNGSPLAWANLHRLHHATSDQENDPHNPTKIGWFNALFVMNLFKGEPSVDMVYNLKRCRDLTSDKYHMFFHKYLWQSILATYVLLGVINLDWLAILLIATAVSFIGLFFTTYVYHFKIPGLHYRNHETTDNSHNNWLSTILFPGEAYHNNHHNDASSYNPVERWFEFDLSALIINLIKSKND